MPAADGPLTPKEALAHVRDLLRARDPSEGELREDDFGNPLWVVRRDLTHLDADAMNDRLHAWIARDVHERVPGASADVRWDHAHPEHPHIAAELEFEDAWHDVEPTLRLDVESGTATPADLEAWVALIPRFLEIVGGSGRPKDWRDPEMGAAE